ncbi:MAG: hypothetical protein KDA65_03320 [Planctomycetaceae bacterium]|nr:hypothetical protein [Planctomycetaceae bacterium]
MNTEAPQPEALPILRYLLIGGKAVISHWRTVVVVFIATFILTQAISMVLPRKYASEAKLFVKVGKESIGVDPTATTGTTLPIYESREAEIRSIMEIITSRAVLERVIDKVGPQVILGSSPTRNAREKAITQLSSAVSVDRGTKSSVITLSMKEGSPEDAQYLLRVFLEQFRDLHMEANSTEGSYEFFVQQSKLVEEEYEAANQKLQAAKNSLGVTSLVDKRKVFEAKETELQKDRQITEANLAKVEAEIRGYRKAIEEIPERLKTLQRDIPNISMDPTIKLRDELLIQREELLTKFTENNPRVKTLDKKIAEAEKVLSQSEEKRAELNEDTNPTYLKLMEELKKSEATAIGLRARQARLEELFTQLQSELENLNAHEGEISSLTKLSDVLLEKLYSYNSKKEEARINRELRAQNISNVNVFQEPTFVEKPVSPRQSLILVAGFLFSLLSAIAVPLLMEHTQFTHMLPEISLKEYAGKLAKTT